MNLTKQRSVADLGDKKPPQRLHRAKNGLMEKAPWGSFFKAVHPCGAVVRIPLHNGRANVAPDDPYRQFILTEKPRQGFVPYGQCPQTLPYEIQEKHLPDSLRGRMPCRTSIDGGPISNEQCCACVEELIEYRKKAQAERMAKVEIRSVTDKQLEISEQTASAIRGVAEMVKEMRSQPAQRGRGRVDE